MRLNFLRTKKIRVKVIAIAFTCLMLVLSGGGRRVEGQITQNGNRYSFLVHYKSGQRLRYLVKTISTAPQASTTTVPMGKTTPRISTAPMVIEVMSVKGDVATLKLSIGPITVDNKLTPSSEQTTQLQIDSHNKTVNRGQAPIGAGLPPKPIAVGETYEINQTVTRNGKPIKVMQKYTFKGIKTIDGKAVAQLDAVTNTQSLVTTTSTNTIYLAVEDGSLFSTHSRTKAVSKSGTVSTSNTSEVIITRIP